MERHSLDPLSLVGGLVLVGAGFLGFFGSIDIGLDAWQYVGPLVLIAIGAVLVLAAPWSRRDRDDDEAPRGATDVAEAAEDADATAELALGDNDDA